MSDTTTAIQDSCREGYGSAFPHGGIAMLLLMASTAVGASALGMLDMRYPPEWPLTTMCVAMAGFVAAFTHLLAWGTHVARWPWWRAAGCFALAAWGAYLVEGAVHGISTHAEGAPYVPAAMLALAAEAVALAA